MNTNAQAVTFANSRIRPAADVLYGAYLTAKKLVQDWNSQSVGTVIPNDATVIADGAATDGRPPMTDAQATNVITRAIELIQLYENGVISFNATASLASLGTITAVEVNGRSAF